MTPKALLRTLAALPAAILLSALAACDDYDSSPVGEVGRITVSLDWERRLLAPDGSTTDILIPLDPPAEDVSVTMQDLGGGGVHTWDSFSTFPQDEVYLTGAYLLKATWGNPDAEGYDTPAYAGETEASILPDRRTDAVISMTAVHAFFNTTSKPEADASRMGLAMLEAHTPGGVFHPLTPEGYEPEGGYLCLKQGETSIVASVYPGGGRPAVRVEGLVLPSTIPGALYTVGASLTPDGDGCRLTVEAGGKSKTTRLTRAMLEGRPPAVSAGWDTSETYSVSEGEYPDGQFTATVAPGSCRLSAVNLSVCSASLTGISGFPAEVNLLSPTPEQKAMLNRLGVSCSLTPEGGGTADLTELISHLVYLDERSALSTLSLEAVGEDGVSAPPAEARILTRPVDIEVTVPEPTVICVDRARLHIICRASNFASNLSVGVSTEGSEPVVVPAEVTGHGDGAYDVSFSVPAGTEPVDVRVFYCEEERACVSIDRVMPEFEVKADAYARYAMLKVVTADPALTEPVTRLLRVRLNGQAAPLFGRQPDKGLLTVTGLKPDTEYSFETTLFDGLDVPLTPKVTVRTEPARQLPNCDFEDSRPGPRYERLASGGRYSQTTVEIFNWQHHTDISEEVPAGWANTNAKTFNKQSRNHNTWYMQPSATLTRKSAFSGSYAVRLSSVAFDLDGEPIPDYVQTGKPYLDYSPVVPHIAHRAAGKIFIGTYTFDHATLTETYAEGMAWNSRPASLSGRYRFIPADANRSASGLARIEVTGIVDGRETVIASDSRRLTLASDYSTFTIPLLYNTFGVKAARIKVMFASSADIGTIEEETRSIATQPDPVTATSTGGELWIDNITLGY